MADKSRYEKLPGPHTDPGVDRVKLHPFPAQRR